MNYTNEVKRFEKSFRLHSSRYNLYSQETLVKGATKTHNQAVKALGKLDEKVVANPSLYSDLLLELLQDSELKVALCAGFTCLTANIYTDKAIDTLVSIAKNTSGISMICDFDIRGTITKFRKKQLDALPRNEVDAIAEKMKSSETYTDAELLDMVLKLQNVNMGGHDGRTALIHACICNRFDLVKELVEHGADVNEKDHAQKTALHCAVIVGNLEIISLLLNAKADVNAQDKRGFTALDFARVNVANLPQDEIDKLAELLISHGAKTKNEILNV